MRIFPALFYFSPSFLGLFIFIPNFPQFWSNFLQGHYCLILGVFLDVFARFYFSCPPHLIHCQCCRSIRAHPRLSHCTRSLLLQCSQLSCRAWGRGARGKRGGCSPEPAARHSRSARVPQTVPNTGFPEQIQPESRRQSQIRFLLKRLG